MLPRKKETFQYGCFRIATPTGCHCILSAHTGGTGGRSERAPTPSS